MSKVEEGSLLFRRFTRVALALSAVTSSFIFANAMVDGYNSGGTELRDNETNSSIGKGIDSNGGVVTVNSSDNIRGAIVAGEFSSYTDSNGNYQYDYNSSHNSVGTAIGLDINDTGVTTLSNLGTIDATVSTRDSYNSSSTTVEYPEQNNTRLEAVGVNIDNDIEALSNSGTISARATLNNDTNNSSATAVGVLVGSDITNGGIHNTGNITATASKTDVAVDSSSVAQTRTTQGIMGGDTGKNGSLDREYTTGEAGSSITDTTRPVGIFLREEQEVRASSEAGITETEYDFKQIDSDVVEHISSNVVSDTITAVGVEVGAVVTGGLYNQNYISSVDINSSGELNGDANGHRNGLSITPNELATGGALVTPASSSGDDNETDPDTAEADANSLVASYEQNITNYDGNISKWVDDHNMTDFFRNSDANTTQDTRSEMAYFYNDGNFSGDINATAVENFITDDEGNIGDKPEPAGDFADHVDNERPVKPASSDPDITVNEAEVSAVVTTSIDSGVQTARVGDIHNAGKIVGADGGHGIEARATSGSNVNDILNDVNSTLDANITNNAYVTSGTVSAYIGEGSTGRTVTQNSNGDVTNTLIGGISNGNLIEGKDAKSGIHLEADSSIDINGDDGNKTDNLNIQTDRDSAGNIVPIYVQPSSTVAVGRIENNASGTIKGGAGGSGISMLATGDSAVLSYNDGNITGGNLIVNPKSLNSVKELINYGTIEGGDGGNGVLMEASSSAQIAVDGDGQTIGANITVSPLVTNRIDLLANIGTIKAGMGGYGINGSSTAIATISSKDINSSNLSISPIVNSTIGDLYNTDTVSVSLAKDAIRLTSDGLAELKTDEVNGSTVDIYTQSTGGVRIKGNATSDGNFVNGGTIKAALSANAVNMDANGKAVVDTATNNAPGEVTTEFLNSAITVKDKTISGTEGSFVNIATSIESNRTKTVQRGTISSALSQDAITQEATGETKLLVKNIQNSTVVVDQTTIAGVGGDFDNGGTIKVALSKNAIDLSSTATTTAYDSINSDINGSTVTTRTVTRAGVGGDFVNGAYALEDGEEKSATTLVNNPTSGTSNYYGGIVAAEIDETNSSIRVSIGAHDNNVTTGVDTLANSAPIFYHDREDAITTASISASLSADAVKFESKATDTLSANDITAITTTRVKDGGTDTFETMSTRSNVISYTESNSSINGNFVNNGQIKSALSANAINGASTAQGTLGDAGNSVVVTSNVAQTTISRAGVVGDFENRVISSDVGEANLTAELSGTTEVARTYYSRATNVGEAIISASLSKNAIDFTSDTTNELTIKSANADSANISVAGSQTTATTLTLSQVKADALTTRSNISSTSASIAGIGGDFINTGTIKVALSASGVDATATGKNSIDTTGGVGLYGSNITADSYSTAGVRGDFENGVESLDTGDATLLAMDVKDINGNPIYYVNNDPKEGERVKSNVIDTNARVIGQDGHSIDSDGIVYNQELIKGEIKAALSKNPIKVDASANVVIEPLQIGMSSVEHLTLVDSNRSKFDSNRTVRVTSVLNSRNIVEAGIGGRFTNKNLIKSSLSAEVIQAEGEANSKFGNTITTLVDGLEANITTIVSAGIGNGSDVTNRGFINVANSYDVGEVQTGTSQIKVNNNSATVIASNANDDNTGADLDLIDSETIAFWNKELVVGTMTSSLAKEVIKVEGTAQSTINPIALNSATTDVTLTDGTTVAVEDYMVAGTARTTINSSTTTIAGINGGFTNQGALKSSLAKEVVNAQATATGNVGGANEMAITGANVNSTTAVVAGIQNGGFKNEAISLDLDNGQVLTQISGTTESPKLIFDKDTTVGSVVMSASLSKDVLLLNAEANNEIKTAAIHASEAVNDSTAGVDADVKSARSVVNSTTTAIGGIGGTFYNNAVMSASLSKNVVNSVATSDNDLGDGEAITGSIVTATASSDTQIRGAFINDAQLLDTGAPTIKYRVAADGNLSNVVQSITYDQEIAKGEMSASLSKDVLNLTAEGTNNIKLGELGYDTIKRVVIDETSNNVVPANTVKSFSEHNISSTITANNTAKSGILGAFVNRGDMTTSLSGNVLNFQAVGGASTVEIDKISGGDVNVTNTVISGVNLGGDSNSIAFLNDKKDFNTVLETDTVNYDPSKVVTGTIKSDTSKNAINLVANGGVKTDIAPDLAGMDTTDGVDSRFEIAKIDNRGDNSVVINGHFVNRGDIKASTAPNAIILSATNSVTNDIDAGIVNDGAGNNKDGMVSSIAMADVNTSINGTLDNSGLIKTATGKSAISLISDGGTSSIVGTVSNVEGIEYASANGIEIAKNISTTESSIGGLRNTGTIEGADGAKAIVLDADGIADSLTGLATLPDTTATNAVFINRVTSTAKIGNIYNSGTIKTADATVIDLTANGGAKMVANTSAQENIEDTSAVVIASIGDITNDAYTEQNIRRDVNKAFNGGVQLLPTESEVVANRGEYDFASFGTTDSDEQEAYGAGVTDINGTTRINSYNYSSGTKIVSDSNAYSEEANLTALAYEDGDSTKNPVLSQTIGEIKTATGSAAISLVAVATDSNTTTVKVTAGNILNRGLIDGGTGKGIFLSSTGVLSDGTKSTGAKAYATAGYIHNAVTHQEFRGTNGVTLHSVIEGEIKGEAGAIVLDATVGDASKDEDKQNVSITTVDTIINNRLVLDKGETVISSDDGITADGKVKSNATDFTTVQTIADNYGTKVLDKDTVFNAVIGNAPDKVAINIGQYAHVTNGIHNFGIIKGEVKLGDADLYLYGLVEDNASKLHGESAADNYVMSQAEFETGAFEQRAGIVDADNGITNSYAGSSIVLTGTHLLKPTKPMPWSADEIIISSDGVVNIQKDTIFNVMSAQDIYNRGTSHTFKNQGILNIAANQGVNIIGTYEQTGKLYINVKSDGLTFQGDEAYEKDVSAHGQLNVTGRANFGNSEIRVVLDDSKTDAELLAVAKDPTETRISDVIVATDGVYGSGTDRVANKGSEDTVLTGLNVTTNRSGIGMRTMQGSADGHVDLAFYYVPPTPASTGAPTGGGSAAVQTVISRDFSEMISSRLAEIRTPAIPTGSVGGRIGNSFVGGSVGVTTGSGVGATGTVGSSGSSAVLSESGEAMSYSEISPSDSQTDTAIEGLALGAIGSVDGGIGSQASAWIKPFASWAKQDGESSTSSSSAQNKNENIAKTGDSGKVNTGYSASTYGLAAGVDKMYKGWRIGTAIAATSSTLDGESSANYTDDMTGVQITEYAGKKLEDGYVNLQVGLGYMKHDTKRVTTDAAAEKITSDFDSYVFQAKVGYEKPLPNVKSDKLDILAYGDADYIHVSNKSYKEKGSISAYKVDDIDTDALILGGGLKANYAVGDKSAIYGNVGIGYDVIGDKVETDVTPVYGGDSVRVNGEKPEQFEYNVGLGYETTLSNGLNIRAGIDHKGRDGYRSDTASIKFTLPF